MNAIVKYEAVSFGELQQMAERMAKAKLFGTQTADQLMSLMLIAQANGQHPAAAARDYDVIQGRPAKKAEAMLRDFLLAGGSVEWHAYTDLKCDATFSHPQGGSVRVDWDKARMQRAKISNDAMYAKYPRNMFRARCISEGVRTVYPVATGGMHAPEEARSMAPVDMGPAVEVPTELLEQARTAARGGLVSLKAWWKAATVEQRGLLKDYIAELDGLVATAEAAKTPAVDAEFVEAMNTAEAGHEAD